ncbi:MAG: putative metallopeptidase [Candidatus Levybacteria bacterium]|nr:putative metallopeptidase [Candidatus Levybacteria bacterium]
MWLISTPKRKLKVKSHLPAMLRKAMQAGKLKVAKRLEWDDAGEIKIDIEKILKNLSFPNIDASRIFCFRTSGSKSRSYARIWAMPKIFQRALNIKPAYVIEVLSKYYDKLDDDSKKKVLIHELLHIPKNFSGTLLPHRSRHRHLQTEVNKLFAQYKKFDDRK